MTGTLIEQTLDRLNSLTKAQVGPGLNVSAGLQYYDLEAEAKLLYPVLAPIRKRMPRIGARGAGQGLAAHWNIITDPNSTKQSAVVSEGHRGAQITPATAPKLATYKGIGLENVVTWEAEYGAEGYDNLRALAQRTTLDSLIVAEEKLLLWGNGSQALGQTAQPTAVASTTGGTLAAGTTSFVFVAPLTHSGYYLALAQSPVSVVPTQVRLNADATTDTINGGVGIMSVASAAITTTGSTSKVVASVAAVKGAVGYAWFIGATATAANAYFSQVTSLNTATITSQPVSGQTAAYTGNALGWSPATDYSINALAFDGLITQAMTGNGYFASLDGGTLTSDAANGIVEIDNALKFYWDTYQISPSRLYVGSQVMRDLTKKIFNGGSASPYRINLTPNGTGGLIGSAIVDSYINKYAFGGAVALPVELHPYMPDGHMFFDLETNPYPTANIPIARSVRTRRDYFNVLWPVTGRAWTNGVYADLLLQCYVPYGTALISNIGPG